MPKLYGLILFLVTGRFFISNEARKAGLFGGSWGKTSFAGQEELCDSKTHTLNKE